MRELACVVSVAPAGIVPTAPPPDVPGLAAAPAFFVSVLPLAVVTGFGAAGTGLLAALVAGPLCAGRCTVRGGLFTRGLGVAVVVGAPAAFAGTSLSCGCAVVSRFASARSRFNVESVFSPMLSTLLVPALHAPRNVVATSNDA